ncbi:MAG TPA: hypothetical protein VNT33_13610, partial [Telluria sp.]|nr:hypothetical protein [Telluria sp.]
MDTHGTDTQAPKARQRRWPRYVAIGAGVTVLVLGGAYWYLGRETTLQDIAQRVAKASGGKLTLSGVSGSLYGHMHVNHIVYRTEDQVVTADNVDIDWSPWQFASSGLAVSKLYAASVKVETLRETEERTPMPATLAPPFSISVDDARVGRATFVSKGVATPIDNIRLGIHGDKLKWELRHAAASTPWGQVAASGSIAATRPYKLDANASFTETRPAAGRAAAQLKLKAGGNLESTTLDVTGQAGRATGDARFVLAPYAEIPLRSLALNGRNINPGFFNPSLPTADLALAVTARLDEARNITGSVDLTNSGPVGTIDQQRLPLRAMHGQLGGNLSAMRISDVLLDLGAAGRFTGSGTVQRDAEEKGLGTATFALHTDRLDLKHLHGSMKPTAIAGDIKVTNADGAQVFDARLAEKGMRLDAHATLARNVLELREARLAAGKGSVAATGTVDLGGNKDFRIKAQASHFNPAAFGKLPEADINANVSARGAIAPEWRVAADFAITPSRLLGQPLSGKGKLDANAKHISGVDASLALGRNLVSLNGSFGAPGERLLWRLDGKQLDALRGDLYGSLVANGAITGTMKEPRTSFDVVASSLGWVPAQRKNNTGELRASGEAWLGGTEQARVVEVKASGSTARLNPAAFGSPLPGSVNATFDGNGRFGGGWRGALNLNVQQSTLSNSPFWGIAKIAADDRHIA